MRKTDLPKQLCISLPRIGELSETFLDKHVNDILPSRTCVIANKYAASPAWQTSNPILLLHLRLNAPPLKRILRELVGSYLEPKRILAFVRQHESEAFIAEYMSTNLASFKEIKRAGLRWYTFGHGVDISKKLLTHKWQTRYRRLRSSDGIFVRSNSIRNKLIQCGFPADKISVVYSGVDVPTEPIDRPVRDEVRVLFVGRLVAKKGPFLTLQAFEKALLHVPNLRLDIVGTGYLEKSLQSEICDRKLESTVRLLGPLPHSDVLKLVRRSDIYAMHCATTSEGETEGLPTAILESMAHALPVVSTRHAGIPEAIDDGDSGYLVNEGDIGAMAERLVALAANPRLRRQLGQAGYERARAQFSWEQERARILELTGLGFYGRMPASVL